MSSLWDGNSYSSEELEAAALEALEPVPAGTPGARPELVRMFREATALLAAVVPPVTPPPSLRERLMNRIQDYEALKPIADVRQDEGAWASIGVPGVDIKTLFRDKKTGRTTMLVRMQPGARLPAHRHHDDEQCLVLSGDIGWREVRYEAGDFVVMAAASDHPEINSVHGNVLLIIAGRNEYVRA